MLSRQDCGLLVVDVQGKLARIVDDSDMMVHRLCTLIKGAKLLNLPIIWVEQNPAKLGSTIPEVSQLLDELTPFSKVTFNAMASDDIRCAINTSGCNQWLVCGIESHICVYQSVMAMSAAGYEVEVVEDAVSSRDPKHKSIAIEKFRQQGIAISCVEMAIYELLQTSDSDLFKAFLVLIR